jgi:preprotein translocase SecE subunit
VTLGGGSPPEGLRSGVFIFAAGGLLLFLISLAAGQLLERYILKSADSRTIGLGLTLAIGVGLLVAAVRYMLKPKFYELLMKFDSQGWFRARFYKPNQGLWVRRLTILGLLAILGTGIWHFVPASGAISTAAIQALKIRVPFLYFEGKAAFAHLLPNAAILGPIIMAVAAFWLSWRAVNFPMFADFLIASEAEMNKVSWTSRKRLIQDTIVVLTTVVLFTFFLLAIDQVWGWVLSRDIIKIVPKARSGEAAKVENVEQDY